MRMAHLKVPPILVGVGQKLEPLLGGFKGNPTGKPKLVYDKNH